MGSKLIQLLELESVKSLKSRTPVCVKSGTKIKDVLTSLRDKRRGCAIVLKGNQVVGIFTERDLITKVISKKLSLSKRVDEVMTTNPTVLSSDSSIAEAVYWMSQGGYRHIPLVNKKGEIQGFVSIRDILDYLAENFPYEILALPPNINQINRAPEGA